MSRQNDLIPQNGGLRAVFFDMDDTVLEPLPYNPWAEFKRRHGLEPSLLILDGIALRPEGERAGLHEALLEYELELCLTSNLRAGMAEALAELDGLGVVTALITNNHAAATKAVLERHNLEFEMVLTREDAAPKPRPDLILLALRRLGLRPCDCVFVGDSEGDLLAARDAGVEAVFLATPHNVGLAPRLEGPRELVRWLTCLTQKG